MKKEHTWDYRIIRHKEELKLGFYYLIHEVHFTNGKPHSWTEDPVYAGGTTKIKLIEDLLLMISAYHKPMYEVVKGELRIL